MGIPLFEPRDGDMQISVNETRLETYKYLIKRFRGLRLLGILEKNPLEISAQRNNLSAKDSCATFRILYAFVVSGPFALTSQTHISTLQVATTYEYQALWDYCIQRLETPELDAVKRIELAHEFDVPEWENPEVHAIGLDAFVINSEILDQEQRRRGREIDAVGGAPDMQPLMPAAPNGDVSCQEDPINGRSRCDILTTAPLRTDTDPLGDASEATSFRSSVKQVNSPAATKLPRDPPSPRPTLKFAPANVPEGTSEKAPDKVPTNVPEQTPVVNLAGTGGPPVPTLIPNQIMLQNLFHGNQRYSRSTGHCHQPRIVQIPANTTDKYLSSAYIRPVHASFVLKTLGPGLAI
ncbi:unnamed protein product [Rhizoctonia solani]|uniref:BTB domain-containing protein n=1 Tax=Rhizoctonia solani TaxID=456999 RepID=A0A8H2WQ45_9AGAM|nr:unnamed protein product [Rhizoctonia solani]